MNPLDTKDKEIAIYGLKRLGMFFCSIIVVYIIGLLLNQVSGLFLFLLFFIPLRIFAGGLHLSSLIKCAVSSLIFILFVGIILMFKEFVIKYIEASSFIPVLLSFIIALLAPVDTESKRLYRYEIIRYKIITIVMLVIELIFFYLAQISDMIKVVIYTALAAESIYLTLQLFFNRLAIYRGMKSV